MFKTKKSIFILPNVFLSLLYITMILKKTKKIPFNNFTNFQISSNSLKNRTKKEKRDNKREGKYSINKFIKNHKPIPMLKELINKLKIPNDNVEFFTDIKVESGNPSKGLTITSEAGKEDDKLNKIGINTLVSNKKVKNKLKNDSTRFKIGVLQIYPGKRASRYLKVIGHVNLVIIDKKEKQIFHYEPKKKGLMLSIERKFRYQMGKNEIIKRLNEISKKNNNNNNNNVYDEYTYHKFYGNQPSFNKYCTLYIVYAALKFTKNIENNILFQKKNNNTDRNRQVQSLSYRGSIDNYFTQLFKSIKQKDVRNLLIYYINLNKKKSNKSNSDNGNSQLSFINIKNL